MALGHMLVLVQCDWPSMRDLLYLTLHRIKMKQVRNMLKGGGLKGVRVRMGGREGRSACLMFNAKLLHL